MPSPPLPFAPHAFASRDRQVLPKVPGLPLCRCFSAMCCPHGAAGGARVQPRSGHSPPALPSVCGRHLLKRLGLSSRVDLPSVNRVCKTLAENLGGLKKIYFLVPYEGLQADLACRLT